MRDGEDVIEYGGQVVYQLPEPLSDKPSCLMFTQPKSGSSLVRGILRKLARQSGLMPTGLEGVFFKAGIPIAEIPASMAKMFKPRGYFYHFSNVPTQYAVPTDGRALVHVRDARDVLVSKYYSFRDSHPEPGDSIKPDRKNNFAELRTTLRTLGVDEGVLKLANPKLFRAMKDLRAAADRPGAMLSRYEDMVYRKTEWAHDVCDHFGWKQPDHVIASAVTPFDVFPEEEQTDQHVRQVHPGNYKKKLKPETIEKLNRMLKDELESFGYSIQ